VGFGSGEATELGWEITWEIFAQICEGEIEGLGLGLGLGPFLSVVIYLKEKGKGRGRKQNAMAMVCRASLVFPKSRGSSGSAIRAVAVPPEKVATNDTTSQVSLRLPSSTSSSVQSQLVLMRHGKHSYNNQHNTVI
jgi:hypothetical protein